MYHYGVSVINGIFQSSYNFRDRRKQQGDMHMKHCSILITVLAITLILGACGTPAAPTANPVDLQGTIAAAAFTVIAQTQAAIPTATPIPPTATSTNTPLPTPTFLPLPSAVGTIPPASNGNSGTADPCISSTLPPSLQGKPVKVRIGNSTKATVSVSVYLNQNGPQGACGYRSYSLTPGQSITMNDLVVGCYTIWAWNPDQENYFIATNGTNCLDQSSIWVFDISTSSIKLKQ
jgi:hypothetical protein